MARALPGTAGTTTKDASLKEKMAYKLQTALGKATYGLRKCTAEPIIGIMKEALGF